MVPSGPIEVLHVDDNMEFGEMVSTFLPREDDRLSVHSTTNPEDGLEILADRDIDCIVSDYHMPGYDVIEFLEQLQDDNPHIPYILFTGKGSEKVASEAISAGVTDYLLKEGGTDQYAILANRIINAVSTFQAEQELEQTREYFRTILDEASDYVMIVGEDGQVNYISPAVERVMGYTPAEMEGIVAFELTHPDDLSIATDAFVDLFQNPDQERTVEFRARHADDSWRWLEVRGRNLVEDPVIEGVMVNIRDITQRKERDAELDSLRNRFQAFVEYSSDIITIIDDDGRITYESPALEGILGYKPDERVGDIAFEYIHPEYRASVVDRFSQVITAERETTERIEYRTRHADGTWRWIESIGNAQTDSAIGGYVINSRDITDRKTYERKLEKQNKRLDQFANALSHDLRNPLNVAQGRLKMLSDEFESAHFAPIENAHQRMGGLIEDLLKLAREGESSTDIEPVDLTSLVQASWENVTTGDGRLIVDLDRTINADESRLKQVFENLFANAIKHGGGDVVVRLGELDDGIYIEDDGPGIAEQDRKRIFEAGYSLKHDGPGFGLSIVNEIVDAHEWEIRVIDGSDGGARFEITGVDFVAE